MLGNIILLILLVGIAVAAYYFWGQRGKHRADPRSSSGQPGSASPAGPEPDLDLNTIRPGDIVALWNGKESLVDRVIECRETLPARVTHWKWVFLEQGQVLALTPNGNSLYTDTRVLFQGSEPYERLTGEVEQGGVLKSFEARVRDGSVGRNPVLFDYDGQSYQLLGSGTFGVADQPVPDLDVWRDVSVDEHDNVYFRFTGPEGVQALGLWTSHIALLIGKSLAPADVREVYRAGTSSGRQ
jgi:hypothetical protein